MAEVKLLKRTKFLGLHANIAEVEMSDKYPEGGEPITPEQLGLRSVDFVIAEAAESYNFQYDYQNNTMIAYDTTSGSEVSDETDLSDVKIRIIAVGL